MQTRKFKEVKKDPKEPMDQLIAELDKAEMRYHYVPLAEFRDHILPKSGYAWAKDTTKAKSLLKDAIDSDLILTSRMLLSHNIPEPTTTICLNRSGTRIRSKGDSRGSSFKPIRIRGGPISDTVIEDREDRV